MGGFSDARRSSILSRFPFMTENLPVRYLGLPLLTKRMLKLDYAPLVERIKSRISSLKTWFLSYAGRVQFINSVLTSIMNFWSSAFRLPKTCIKEIDSVCSAFLWSGSELNHRKAKVALSDVCKPKEEGGLGLRSLKEINLVCCLKLIWRLVSTKNLLWANWIKENLIRQGSFWAIHSNSQGNSGSWMWRKLIKYKDVAKTFYKREVRNGNTTSFWHDSWSTLGDLWSRTGARGVIDLGIKQTATVSSVTSKRTWRQHRSDTLNEIEKEIAELRERRTEREDRGLWRMQNGEYKSTFSPRDTWTQIRLQHTKVSWFT